MGNHGMLLKTDGKQHWEGDELGEQQLKMTFYQHTL